MHTIVDRRALLAAGVVSAGRTTATGGEQAMQRIRARLAEYYTPAEAEAWLRSPHPLLNGAVARDLIAVGDAAAVDRVLNQLDAGVYL